MFHDVAGLPEVIRQLLREHLDHSPDAWGAVEDTLVTLIGRFGDARGDFAKARLTLWLNEPGLLARFMHYMIEAEDVITECLRAHRGTTGKRDDLAPVASAAAVAAYRVTLQTGPNGSGVAGSAAAMEGRGAAGQLRVLLQRLHRCFFQSLVQYSPRYLLTV